ncbi:MAG: 4'-phosphopantetheinyl transferase family protein [Acidimicrobiales bacterium]
MPGPLPIRFVDGTTTVEVLSLDDCQPELALLAEHEAARYRSFTDAGAADAYLRRQSELRRRLAVATGRRPEQLRFETEPNGKPFLIDDDGRPAEPHFNLSSSDRLMALAVDFDQPIGVDVECHGLHPGMTAASLAAALHPGELERLSADRLDDILQCWVYKEAWIKWTGEGMRADLKGLDLWRPDLPPRFVHRGAAIGLIRIPSAGIGVAWLGRARSVGA